MRGATPRTCGAEFDGCGHLAPVFDSGVEDLDFVALEVIGGEDLQVTEAGADGVFAKAANHEGKVSAGEKQASHAAADHQQGHQRSAAIAEDVTKRKQQELAHGCLLQGVMIADDAAVGEADDARCVFEQALVVGGEDEGETEAAVQVAHQVDELRGVAGVEVGGGLVGQHQRGTMNDGAGDGDALTLAAGEQVGPLLCASGEADVFERLGNARAALAGA